MEALYDKMYLIKFFVCPLIPMFLQERTCLNIAEHDSLSPSFKFAIKIQVEVTLISK